MWKIENITPQNIETAFLSLKKVLGDKDMVGIKLMSKYEILPVSAIISSNHWYITWMKDAGFIEAALLTRMGRVLCLY